MGVALETISKDGVQRLTIKGKGSPSALQVRSLADSYFDLYKTDSGMNEKGIFEFTDEGLKKISDVAFFNAIGITRQRWNSFKIRSEATKHRRDAAEECLKVEQIFEQVDHERLSTRGNVGDVFRMKCKYNWNDSPTDEGKEKKAVKDLSDDKVAAIIERMKIKK